jgi:SAM-dependent methyltransferase
VVAVFETAEQVRVAVRELTDAVWVLSAMAPVLSSGLEGPFSMDDPAARVLADYGLLEATGSGLMPRPGFAEAFGGRARALADGIRSSLGQAATAAFLDQQRGKDWSAFADEILVAQGRASVMGGRGTAVFVVPVLDGLAERFADGDGVLLDVGVGVAEMACAFCQAVPGARVVGIDPLPRAIELATATVAGHGLAERVRLRCQGVEELEDEEAFDLAWLPLPFIPPAAVREGLPRVLRALRPGGWLLLPAAAVEPGASGEIARWQVHVFGGTLLSDHERTELLRAAGFESPAPLSTPPGALPPLVAARRPR